MRVLLLRIGALGAVVVLGWIAFANAQRGSSATVGDAARRRFERGSAGPPNSQWLRRRTMRIHCAPRPRHRRLAGDAARDTTAGTADAARDAASSRAGHAAGGGRSVCRAESGQRGVQAQRPRQALAANSIPDASVVGLASLATDAAATSRYQQVATPVSAEQPRRARRCFPAVPAGRAIAAMQACPIEPPAARPRDTGAVGG